MTELSEQEARAEMQKLGLDELKELADAQGISYSDDKAALIEMLLGKCGGCKKKD